MAIIVPADSLPSKFRISMATPIGAFTVQLTASAPDGWDASGYSITAHGAGISEALAAWATAVKAARNGLQGEPDAYLTGDGQALRDTANL